MALTLALTVLLLAPTAQLPCTGEVVPELAPFDRLMQGFLEEHGVPGAALCVGRAGEVIYARGFGWADREAGEAVQPDSLFRIASVSKPITSAAVMQLVERGELYLDENPFARIGRAAALEAHGADPRLAAITIGQLLEHTGGFDRGASFDPMFAYERVSKARAGALPPSQADVIDYMLTRPLDFDPGQRYAYSNFGYCVLGRAIEAASGQRYEDYVRAHVLAPLGIERMRIGRSLPDQRADGEVRYYDRNARESSPVHAPDSLAPLPYRIDHEVMDSHGAWIASAEDLVRFALSFDDPAHSPVLSAESIAETFAPPDAPAWRGEDKRLGAYWYAKGWNVRPAGQGGRANTWHSGLIQGTSSLLVRRHDGLAWAVLFNCDRSVANDMVLSGLIDKQLHEASAMVECWPNSTDADSPTRSGK